MKLFYFNMTGRAETPRLLMKLGGKSFEDVRFSGEEWGAKFKAQSPSGQCPWLELDDGRKLTQSSAISYYCASEAGMLPSDPFEVGRTIELTNSLEEFFMPLMSTLAIKDPDEKVSAREALIQPDGAACKKMNNVEGLVSSSTSEFFCGDEATLADIHLFTFLGTLRSGVLDGIDAEFLDSFEKVAELRSKVASMPKVKELYAGETGYEP